VGPLRVGVIGVGWGSSVHVPAFRSVAGFELAALCGRSERVVAVAAAAGVADVARDWEAFVRRDDLDLIAIATPVALHHPMAMAAIAAGKHVLCEKPLALDEGQARELAAAADAAGVVHATGYEWRWTPERLALATAVQGGVLGDPYFVHITHHLSMWHPASAAPAPWKFSAAEGGGFLNAVLCHELDCLRQFFGEPEAIQATTATLLDHRMLPDGTRLPVDADDTVVMQLRFPGGMTALIDGSSLCYGGSGVRWEAYGSGGSVGFAGGPQGNRAWRAGAGSAPQDLPPSDRTPLAPLAVPPTWPALSPVQATALMLEDWLPRFAGGSSPVATLWDGLRIQQLADAARRSSAEGGWVALPAVERGVS